MENPANKTGVSMVTSHQWLKRSLGIFIFYLIACLLLPMSFASANDIGTSIEEKIAPPSRILSLDLCTDWMLVKFAKRSQVLALSPLVHQYPVDWMNSSWPTHDGSLEQILELKPDLVITGEYNALQLRQRLQELGVNVAILELPRNLDQVTQYEKHFLSLIGDSSKQIQEPVIPKTKANSYNMRPRLLLLGANGIGTGQQTFENDVIQHAGWANYLKAKGNVSLDLEKIVTDPPDAILWSGSPSRALSNLFAQHPLLKQTIPKDHWLTTEHWKWRCPGPWTWDLVKQLHDLLPQKELPTKTHQ